MVASLLKKRGGDEREGLLTNYFGGLLSRPPPEGLPGFLLGQPPLPLPTFFTSSYENWITRNHQEWIPPLFSYF